MRTRRLHPLFRLIASLLFGLSVLAFFFFVSSEMATHYFQGVAERTIRKAFSEAAQTADGPRHDSVCRGADPDGESASECDPIAIKAERALRSTSCGDRSLLHLLGRQWSCVARFTNGESLEIGVSLGLRRSRLELVLPFREADPR
jgi:hypothetical protein